MLLLETRRYIKPSRLHESFHPLLPAIFTPATFIMGSAYRKTKLSKAYPVLLICIAFAACLAARLRSMGSARALFCGLPGCYALWAPLALCDFR